MSQLTFDLDAMIHEMDVAAAPAWTGAPLHFTTAYWNPADLDAAWSRYVFENGHFNCLQASHMWHRPYIQEKQLTVGAHTMDRFEADLHHSHLCPGSRYQSETPCTCLGSTLYQAICTACGWHHISSSENDMLGAWHDHAMPGWRTLPVAPEGWRNDMSGKLSKNGRDFLDAYPTEWTFAGAPILAARSGIGTRAVPGRSPFGGYDFAAEVIR